MLDHLRPLRLPRPEVGPDTWRQAGVTHWHLVRSDWQLSDRARFASAESERLRPTHGVADDPAAVVEWMRAERARIIEATADPSAVAKASGLATDADWDCRHALLLRRGLLGEDVMTLQAMGSNRIAHLSAYAMTSACSCRRQAIGQARG